MARLAAALAALALAAPAGAQLVDPAAAQLRRLSSGTPLVVLEAPSPAGLAPRVAGLALLSAGSVHERPQESGLVAVLARALLGGGSLLAPGPELAAWLAERGAQLSIEAGRAELALTWSCAPGDLREMLARVHGLLQAPAYPEPVIAAARTEVLAELLHRQGSQQGELERALTALAFGERSPWTRLPDLDALQRLERTELLSFHRAHLGLDRLAIGLGGDVRADEVARWLGDLLRDLGRVGKAPAVALPQVVAPKEPLVWLVAAEEAERAELAAAFPVAVAGPADEAALLVWSEVYEVASDADAAGSGALRLEPWRLAPGQPATVWRAASDCEPQEARETLAALLRATHRGTAPAVSEATFESARRLALERLGPRPLELALRAATRAALFGPPPPWRAELERELLAVSPERMRSTLDRVLPRGGHVVAVRGPLRQIERPLAELARVSLYNAPLRPRGTPDGLALRARLLQAMGGSAPWARLSALHQEGEAWRAGLSDPVGVRTWRDLLALRLRLEQRSGGETSTQVVAEAGGWTLGAGTFRELSETERQRVLFRERRQLHQVLRDLASQPSLHVRADAQGRLEVLDGQVRLCWIQLAPDDRPAFLGYAGPGADEQTVYTYSDWREVDGRLFPFQVEQEDKNARFVWTRQNALLTLDEALFQRPVR